MIDFLSQIKILLFNMLKLLGSSKIFQVFCTKFLNFRFFGNPALQQILIFSTYICKPSHFLVHIKLTEQIVLNFRHQYILIVIIVT